MKLFKLLAVAAALALPAGAAIAKPHGGGKDIVDVAAGAGTFNTLVAAAKAAGLVDTLKSKGPLTVFAPTDAAFAKLPKGTVENLLKPENKAQLAAILKYHVVAGKIRSADIKGKKTRVASVEGRKLSVNATKGVKINGANVVKADVAASNGVIHVVDTVLLPPAKKHH